MASKSYASNKCCSVLQCSSRAGGGISLHTFPKNAALTKRWKHILRIGKPITKDMYVCSLHFKQKDFYAKPAASNGKRSCLKKGVFPSQHIPQKVHGRSGNDTSETAQKCQKEHLFWSRRNEVGEEMPMSNDEEDYEMAQKESDADRRISKMVGCSALFCSNSTKKGTRLFRFPSDPERRAVWVYNCRRNHWKPKDSSRLCEVHFTEDQYESCRLDGRKLLKQNAVPTSFIFPAHLKVSGRKGAPVRIGLEDEVHRDPVKLENSLLENTNTIEDFNYPSDNISEPEKKIWRGRVKRGRKKQLKTDEDEVIEYIESLEARKRLPHCVVCSRPLRQNKKEYLSTLTSTTGLSLHQCLIGIADGKSTNIQDFTASDMVCFYCAHLINYADALEAELMKLKNAINGCLEIQNMNEEDQEMLKPEFDSHIAILDEYSERVVGPGSAAERESLVDESHPPVDTGTLDLDKKNECPLAQENGKPFVINSITSIPGDTEPTLFEEDRRNYVSVETKTSSEAEIWKNRTVEGDELLNAKESSPLKVDPPQLECKICNLRTSSRSVLLFHLRRHMAHYQWCDFCDYTIIDEDEGELASKPAPT